MKCCTVVEVLILLLSLNARILGETTLTNSMEFLGNRSKYKPIKTRNQEKTKTLNNIKIVSESKNERNKKDTLKKIESTITQKNYKDPKFSVRNDTNANNRKTSMVADEQVIFNENSNNGDMEELDNAKYVHLHSDTQYNRGCDIQAVLCNILYWEAEMGSLIDYGEFMNCFNAQHLQPRHHFKLRNLIKQLTKDQVLETFINYLNQLNLKQTFSLTELSTKCHEYKNKKGKILEKIPPWTDENTTNSLPYENNTTNNNYYNPIEQSQNCSDECCRQCRTNIHNLSHFISESLNNSQQLARNQFKQFYDTIGKLNAKNAELVNNSNKQSEDLADIQNSLTKVAGHVTELKTSPEQCCTKWDKMRNEFDRKYNDVVAANKRNLNAVKDQLENIKGTLKDLENVDTAFVEQQKNDFKKLTRKVEDLVANERDRQEEMESLQDKVAGALKSLKKITSNVDDNTKQQSAALENLEETLNKYKINNAKQGNDYKNKIRELEQITQNLKETMEDKIKQAKSPEANDDLKKLLQQTENTVLKNCSSLVKSSTNDLQEEFKKQLEADKNNEKRIKDISKKMELQEQNIEELKDKLTKATAVAVGTSTAASVEQEELAKLKKNVEKALQDLAKLQNEDGKVKATKTENLDELKMEQAIKRATDEVVQKCNKRIDDAKSDFEGSLTELKNANTAARKRETELENQLKSAIKSINENREEGASTKVHDKLDKIETDIKKCETTCKESNAQIDRLNVRVTALEQKNINLDKRVHESESLLRKSSECSAGQYSINQDLDERLFQIEQILNGTMNGQLQKIKKRP